MMLARTAAVARSKKDSKGQQSTVRLAPGEAITVSVTQALQRNGVHNQPTPIAASLNKAETRRTNNFLPSLTSEKVYVPLLMAIAE
jgi:hypothetical protein